MIATALVLVALAAGQGTAPSPAAPAAQPPGVLIVLNKGAATADFFDPRTGARLRTLATGIGPHEGAVTPDGRLAVVANYGGKEPGGTLALFDLARGEALETLDLGGPVRPHGLAFAGGLLLVTAEQRGALLAVDLAQRAVVKTVPTLQAVSHMVATTPDGKRAFVANIGSGSITAIDLGTFEVIRSVPTGGEAEGLAVSPDGAELWVTNRAADTVTVLDAATLEPRATLPCPGFPIRVELSPDGALALVSAPKAGEVAVFDARTRALKARVPLRFEPAEGAEQGLFGGSMGESAQPIGILIPPEGREAYVACSAADRVAVLDLKTLAVVRSFASGREPDGLAWYTPLE